MADEVRVRIASDLDMVPARAEARSLAIDLGFSRTEATLIATAISEIARNIVVHAREGEITLSPRVEDGRYGLVVVACDAGPGMDDVEGVLQNGTPSRGGLGLGIAGARRLMDEFAIQSKVGYGTTVTMVKWRTRDELERLRGKRRDGTS